MPAPAAHESRPAPDQGNAPGFWYAEPEAGEDPFDLSPRYREADGVTSGLPSSSRFTATRLAAGFASGGLRREVWAVSPWRAASRRRVLPPLPRGDSQPEEFSARFEDAVIAQIGPAERVAVTVSGGMDSAALLATTARVCRRTGRELVAVALDIPDDDGGRPALMAEALVEALGVHARLLVVEAGTKRWPEPAWCPHGPRFDAWPRYRRGIVETAAASGAQVLLHGTGADELLTTPPHLAALLARWSGLRAARTYLQQRNEPIAAHLAPAIVSHLRRRWSAEWYWALTWPRLAANDPPPTLTATAGEAVTAWADSHTDAQVSWCLRHRATWAQAAVMHTLFPRDLLPPAGDLPERFPFLEPAFARYAYNLPLTARFRADQPTAYLCHKARIAALLPPKAARSLPLRRLRSYQAYARYWESMPAATPLSEQLGILRSGWLGRCRDAFDRAIALSVEAWIRGAVDAGAEPEAEAGAP